MTDYTGTHSHSQRNSRQAPQNRGLRLRRALCDSQGLPPGFALKGLSPFCAYTAPKVRGFEGTRSSAGLPRRDCVRRSGHPTGRSEVPERALAVEDHPELLQREAGSSTDVRFAGSSQWALDTDPLPGDRNGGSLGPACRCCRTGSAPGKSSLCVHRRGRVKSPQCVCDLRPLAAGRQRPASGANPARPAPHQALQTRARPDTCTSGRANYPSHRALQPARFGVRYALQVNEAGLRDPVSGGLVYRPQSLHSVWFQAYERAIAIPVPMDAKPC
jgi:hypothetical protein